MNYKNLYLKLLLTNERLSTKLMLTPTYTYIDKFIVINNVFMYV